VSYPNRRLSLNFTVAVLVASAGAFVFSWALYELSCDENCDGHSWQASGQLICASIGLFAAAAGVVFSSMRRYGWTSASLRLSSLTWFLAVMLMLDYYANYG
jgi:hypothetical protein